jgi:hypothetical protein
MKTYLNLNKRELALIAVVGLACFFWGKSQKPDVWFKSKEEYEASVKSRVEIALEKQKQELLTESEKEFDPNTGKLVKEKQKLFIKKETEKKAEKQDVDVAIKEKKEVDLKINLPPQNALGARINSSIDNIRPQWEIYGRLSQKCILGTYCVEEISIGQDLLNPDKINGRVSIGLEWRF